MTKKRIIKILIFIIVFLILGSCIYIYSNYCLRTRFVYVAKYNLSPRTLISENELERVIVPSSYLNDEVVIEADDILNHYVKINSMIPKGSFIYKNAIEDISQMKDKINAELKDDEVSFDIYTNDVKVNQACIVKGMYVDLYLTINKNEVLSDLLINNVKIIGLYDNNNNEIKDYDNQTILNTICLAVPKDCINYLNKALVIGDLSILIGNDSYTDVKTTLNTSSDIFNYLQ